MRDFDVVVIGAGAAGLMCAAVAGQAGARVLLIEHANKIGRKILMSGGGRCNFTNLVVEPDNFLCSNAHFVKSALSRYSPWHFIELVSKYDIPYHERAHGQLFCDNSAKDIVRLLHSECELGGVQLRTRCTVERVSTDGNGYKLSTSSGEISCLKLVVASGGLSIPSMSPDGLGYELAQQFGLQLIPRSAGLVPLTFSGDIKSMTEKLSGIALPVRATAAGHSFDEAMLFTHRGLSGPAILQISSYWREGEWVSIDLLPDRDMQSELQRAKEQTPKSLLRTVLNHSLARKLVQELEIRWWPELAEKPLADWPDKNLQSVGEQLNNWQLKPAGTEGYRTAEVTLGGVNTDGLSSKTFACHEHPNLYFIGEVLDVSGHLGGFNFQWAWACGHAAGKAVASDLESALISD